MTKCENILPPRSEQSSQIILGGRMFSSSYDIWLRIIFPVSFASFLFGKKDNVMDYH
jgi:hypothetical protein